MRRVVAGVLGTLLLGACAPPRERAISEVKRFVASELTKLREAATRLRRAAPEPDEDGWNAEDDAQAVAAMRAAWHDARDAYERVEGAVGMLFPHLDVRIDERYEHFVALRPDRDPFDADGVLGMHGVERVLWADAIRRDVRRFETTLQHHAPARTPASREEALRFRDELLRQLEEDCAQLEREFRPVALDPAAAFRGLLGSLEEQQEKVAFAGTGQGESRYARRTLADMRRNLEGGEAVFAAVAPWLLDAGGAREDRRIRAGFERLTALYASTRGDELPPVPDGWPEVVEPSEYASFHAAVEYEADPEAGGLMTDLMAAAERMNIAVLPRPPTRPTPP